MIPISPEWLTTVDLARRREAKLNHQNKSAYHYGATPHRASYDAPTQRTPPQDDTNPQTAPPQVKDLLFVEILQDEPPVMPSPT